jgi:predicted methyltransferase
MSVSSKSVAITPILILSWVLHVGLGMAAHHEEPVDLSKKIAEAQRPAEDVARDAGRKPGAVLEFLGVKSGMQTIDLMAAGGYYTEVLSAVVGPEGKVYAQNSEYVLKMREGANEKAISKRIADGRLPNVARLDREVADMGLEPGSIDFAITALNFHDIYNSRGAEAAAAFLASVYAVLAPGGVLGIIDHIGAPGADNETLHRIDPALVEAVVEASPFTLEAQGDMLKNPSDDHTQGVFTPGLRGHTDRFVMLLRKPL